MSALPIQADDGLVYDVDPATGEVLEVRPSEPEFRIDSRERADWVLGKMLALDTEMASIDSSPLVAQARACEVKTFDALYGMLAGVTA